MIQFRCLKTIFFPKLTPPHVRAILMFEVMYIVQKCNVLIISYLSNSDASAYGGDLKHPGEHQ